MGKIKTFPTNVGRPNNVNTTDSFLTRATWTTTYVQATKSSLLLTLCMTVTVDSTRLNSTTDNSQQ